MLTPSRPTRTSSSSSPPPPHSDLDQLKDSWSAVSATAGGEKGASEFVNNQVDTSQTMLETKIDPITKNGIGAYSYVADDG